MTRKDKHGRFESRRRFSRFGQTTNVRLRTQDLASYSHFREMPLASTLLAMKSCTSGEAEYRHQRPTVESKGISAANGILVQ
jgi:hypothetical protein